VARRGRRDTHAGTAGRNGPLNGPLNGQLNGASVPGGPAIGQVAALYVRPVRGAAPQPVQQVHATAGHGLDGDVQCDPLSPRQLLVAGTPAYARLDLPANALRENLLLDVDTAHLASGQLLAVGAQAVLQLTFACEPCGRLNLRQDRLSRTIGSQRGMLARVLLAGPVVVGDPVRLLAATLRPWSNDWRARVEAVLAQVPPGMVVEYRQLALLAGVALTYCRVFPRVARAIGLAHAAVGLRSASRLPRWDGAGLFDGHPGAHEGQAGAGSGSLNV